MHDGHRQRMYSKLENGGDLFDHEVLEILLFSSDPRRNTNPTAHALLERFGSIAEVLKAHPDELKEVEGVGESTARFLRTVGLCLERTGKTEGVAVLKTPAEWKKFVTMRLRGRGEEYLEIYFTEKGGRVKRIFSYTSFDRNKVMADAGELVKNIALSKPYGILASHNHLNGSSAPSENDDVFTKQLQLICSMNNVNFWDHIIYAGENDIYSYRDLGKLDEIREQYKLSKVLKWTSKSN